MCFCDLQCVWSPSGKTSLKINGLPLLRRRLMSLEQIPLLACDLSPTTIGVTGVEARAWRWHPPPSPPILAQTGGAGQPHLGSTCQCITCQRSTKVWPFANVTGNSIVARFLGRTGSFPPQRPFWGLFSLQPFSIQVFLQGKVWLRGPVWTTRAAMQHEVRLSDGVRRASSEPSLAIRTAPVEVEGWDLPPWVIRTSFPCSVQPWTGACRWYCSARNKYW